FNLLLQVFEDGQLTDGLGNTVDFKNTIVVMTSNLGARHLEKKMQLGFQGPNEELMLSQVEDRVRDEVKRLFNPEFLNRLDETILFNALSEEDLAQVVELLVQQLNQHLAHRDVSVTCTA